MEEREVVRKSDPEHRRQQLVEAATAVFIRQGYANTRVADIAAAAGVAKGTVYEYFPSKEEVFLAVFAWVNEGITQRIEEEIAGAGDAVGRLETLFRVAGEIVAEHPNLYAMTLDFWAATRGTSVRDRLGKACASLYEEHRRLISQILGEGCVSGQLRPEIDVDSIATVLVGALDGVGVQHFFDRSVDPRRAAAAFWHAICGGLCVEQR
jgi:AcrR family transcriptional regulator